MKHSERAELAEMYDRLNSYIWLAEQLSNRITTDLKPTIGNQNPWRDYCAGRITARYFHELHPAAPPLVNLRITSLRLIGQIEERETELRVTPKEREEIQNETRELTNLTIDSYDSFIEHIMKRPETK